MGAAIAIQAKMTTANKRRGRKRMPTSITSKKRTEVMGGKVSISWASAVRDAVRVAIQAGKMKQNMLVRTAIFSAWGKLCGRL